MTMLTAMYLLLSANNAKLTE